MAQPLEERPTEPMGPTPWDTVANRAIQYQVHGQIWPVSGDDLAQDPEFAKEFPTLESYLEPPC